MIKEQKSKQKTWLKCILNLTFSSIAMQQKCYDSVDLLISLLFFFCNHTFWFMYIHYHFVLDVFNTSTGVDDNHTSHFLC